MARKGHSALQLSRDLNVQYKTAFVLSHKIREAIAAEKANVTVSGTVAVDGAYFGGHIRPANLKENRVDRRLAVHQTGKRRCGRHRSRKGRQDASLRVRVRSRIAANPWRAYRCWLNGSCRRSRALGRAALPLFDNKDQSSNRVQC